MKGNNRLINEMDRNFKLLCSSLGSKVIFNVPFFVLGPQRTDNLQSDDNRFPVDTEMMNTARPGLLLPWLLTVKFL